MTDIIITDMGFINDVLFNEEYDGEDEITMVISGSKGTIFIENLTVYGLKTIKDKIEKWLKENEDL